MTTKTSGAVVAVDRFLDALRAYFNEGIGQDFNTAARQLANPDPFTWTTVAAGTSIDGDPITEQVMTTNAAPSDPRTALRALVEAHSRDALKRPWADLHDDPSFAALPQQVRSDFRVAVGVVLDVFASQNPGVALPWDPPAGNNLFGTTIEAARTIVYRAANDNPGRDAVIAAAGALAALQAEHDATVAELHQAIETSDLDTISRLRPVVTVEQPAKIDQARQILLNAEADAAAADCAPLVDRQARVEKAAEDATRAVERARQALAAAEARKLAADQLVPATIDNTRAMLQAADRAAAERDVHAANVDAERLRRVRSFAGV